MTDRAASIDLINRKYRGSFRASSGNFEQSNTFEQPIASDQPEHELQNPIVHSHPQTLGRQRKQILPRGEKHLSGWGWASWGGCGIVILFLLMSGFIGYVIFRNEEFNSDNPQVRANESIIGQGSFQGLPSTPVSQGVGFATVSHVRKSSHCYFLQ